MNTVSEYLYSVRVSELISLHRNDNKDEGGKKNMPNMTKMR